jgi:hypothetical protein
MESRLIQYRILIDKLQALAIATGNTTNAEEEFGELVMIYVHCGAPYGLTIVSFTAWMRERVEDRKAPFVLSA